MRKTFKYRIYPNRAQEHALEASLNACRWLYNHFLEQRKTAWEEHEESLSRFDQCKALPNLKKEHKFLQAVNAQVLQNITVRIDLAFRAFFLRLKRGQKPGYPRFRGRHRYDSFTIPQATAFSLKDSCIRLSKIGCVKIRKHRPVEGKVKTCTVRRTKTGKWFVTSGLLLC